MISITFRLDSRVRCLKEFIFFEGSLVTCRYDAGPTISDKEGV